MPRPVIKTSIQGKLFGVDTNNYPVSEANELVSATSATTATAMRPGGITIMSSAVATWTLAAPYAGVLKTIKRNSTSTTTTGTISAGTSSIVGSTNLFANMALTGGAAVSLVGLSTAQWAVLNTYGTVTFTT